MSVLRKQQKGSYTNIDNDLIDDGRLSFRARGIAAYLMSKPDDWEIRINHLTAHAQEGKAAIQSAIRELAELGYLMRERFYNRERGVVQTLTHVADYPAFANHGTPDSRLHGYEVMQDEDNSELESGSDDDDGGDDSQDIDGQDIDDSENESSQNDVSVNESSETDVSIPRQSENPVAVVTTDLKPTTDVVTTEGEGARAGGNRPNIKARNGASKTVRFKSPHFSKSDFVEDRIPPGQGVNPVQVYYERFDITHDIARLTPIQEDDLCQHCPDLDRLREVVIAYSRTNYKPGRVDLILDWYRDGVPRAGANTHRNGAQKNGQNNGYANGNRANYRRVEGDGFDQEEIRIRGKLASGKISQTEYSAEFQRLAEKHGRTDLLQNVR